MTDFKNTPTLKRELIGFSYQYLWLSIKALWAGNVDLSNTYESIAELAIDALRMVNQNRGQDFCNRLDSMIAKSE